MKDSAVKTKDEALNDLRMMLRGVLATSARGLAYAQLLRARGCVDGYMRALLELGIATRTELLDLVKRERERVGGPALGAVELPETGDSVAA